MQKNPKKFVICYRTEEECVYKPLVDGGNVCAVPLGEGHAKIHGASSEMILLDLEPINEKLRKIRREMKMHIESCNRTVEEYKGSEEGRKYALPFGEVAKCLEIYLKQINEALPQLKDDSE